MSRIAKTPISIPDGVTVSVDDNIVKVKGKKGEFAHELSGEIEVLEEEGKLYVKIKEGVGSSSKKTKSFSGTTRALLNNYITGVSNGFERKLNIVGVGYRAQLKGNSIKLSLGFSHPMEYLLPEGVTAEMPSQTEITLRSADKRLLGQVAAEIRSFRPPEPYKGKGVHYLGEHVVRKVPKKKK